MPEGLSDLEDLANRCRVDAAKAYIIESIAAYNAGSYRAAIVTCWIAVVIDILEKMRDLAGAGNSNAKQKVDEFEALQDRLQRNDMSAIDAALKFERRVLEIARDDFELLDGQEFVDLDRLREDRNRCAHPTFQKFGIAYQPTAELARAHIRHAIGHLLQHPPVQGKAAIEALKARVASEFFPTELDKAKQNLLESALRRPTPALVRGFVDVLIIGLLEPGNSLYARPQTVEALRACLDLHRGEAEPRLAYQVSRRLGLVSDSHLSIAVVAACRISEIWEAAPESDKERMLQYLRTGPAAQALRILPRALQTAGMREAAQERIAKSTVDELKVVIQNGVQREAVDKALSYYAAVRSWSSANDVAAHLVIPLAEFLNESDVERILKMPSEGADLVGSGGFTRLLDRIREVGTVTNSWLNDKLRQNDLDSYVDADEGMPPSDSESDELA